MQVSASTQSVRISPRKIRLVIDQVRGLPVTKAEQILLYINKKGAEPVLKLIKSAVASAEHNYQLEKENLVIASITADGGFTIKRFRPRAYGRAGMIRKRTSHLTVVLEDRAEVKPEAAKPKTQKVEKTEKAEPKQEKSTTKDNK